VLNFAIFDHLDSDGGPLGRFFEERLRLLELIERSGFHGYHLAEHHSTPLGMASSPSVFLASAIQRTRTIKLGPLVYVLPLYHPLRLYEDICMLDHLSGGRLTVGVGRGGALIEHQRFGVDPALAPAMYQEAFAVLMRAFETDVLDFEVVSTTTKTSFRPNRARPHPPIWWCPPCRCDCLGGTAQHQCRRWDPALSARSVILS
jgi:alkanesulfonate monooxygenase SsuD/methylene tetrahydromethanopterin reductase-like flavin-dependent oxidoreductase (luciferase family)